VARLLNMAIDLKDVKIFEIKHIESDKGTTVHIEGIIFHSSLVVNKVKLIHLGDSAIIELSVLPAHSVWSGDFVVDVPVVGKIKRILFGQSRMQVWPDDFHEYSENI